MSIYARPAVAVLLAASSLLSACDKTPERVPENQASEASKPVTQAPEPAPEPAPAPEPKPVPVKVEAAPEPSADQQMLDDADATGMTSHVSRDSDAASTTNSN